MGENLGAAKPDKPAKRHGRAARTGPSSFGVHSNSDDRVAKPASAPVLSNDEQLARPLRGHPRPCAALERIRPLKIMWQGSDIACDDQLGQVRTERN
jgi:hypothetical protein